MRQLLKRKGEKKKRELPQQWNIKGNKNVQQYTSWYLVCHYTYLLLMQFKAVEVGMKGKTEYKIN